MPHRDGSYYIGKNLAALFGWNIVGIKLLHPPTVLIHAHRGTDHLRNEECRFIIMDFRHVTTPIPDGERYVPVPIFPPWIRPL